MIYLTPEYVQWLQLEHPEAVSSDRYDLVTCETTATSTPFAVSVAEQFSTLSPLNPLTVTPPLLAPSLSSNDSCLPTPSTFTPFPSNSGSNRFSSNRSSNNSASGTSGSNTTSSTPSHSQLNQSPLTTYLVKPHLPPTTPKAASRKVSGARVLTSADSLKLLEEKALRTSSVCEQDKWKTTFPVTSVALDCHCQHVG